MAEAYPDEKLCLISKGLYRIVSDVIGPECLVKLRRQRCDISNSFSSCDTSLSVSMISGSKVEGFEFISSDFDIMEVDKYVIVLNKNSCHLSCSTDFPTVLFMETRNISPGFTLLKCLRYDYSKRKLYNCLVHRGNDVYVSSQIARDSHLSRRISSIHGPCSRGTFIGYEYDSAYTLKCPFWPKQADSFIYRSLRQGWPSYDVLTDICKDGCLLVPINSKEQTNVELIDLEWRISFSLAEKKLIYSMNHCQFLCYGLMKIFLNDVLKKIPETGELLCSYFMKTAVFWEISEDANGWLCFNFIHKFWNVFRRVMKWVSIGYCPNFFIPQHNMFYGKIYGRHQRDLIMKLRTLYGEGYQCLLRCTSLQEKLFTVINQPILMNHISINDDYVSLASIERERVTVIVSTFILILPQKNAITAMRTLCNTAAIKPTSEIMTSAAKLRFIHLLQMIAMILNRNHGMSNHIHIPNRYRYGFIKTCQLIIGRTKTFFCLNGIYHAVCTYINGNYFKTIQIVTHLKQRFQGQTFMYRWNLDDDIIISCRQQGMSYEAIVNTFIIDTYIYEPDISIEELNLESQVKDQHSGSELIVIPPLVFLNFLLILSYTRLDEEYNRYEILYELQTLVCYDDGYHIKVTYKAISWEILGICQQLCGDYHGAYQSYINALHDDYNEFIKATIVRIISLLFRYKLSTDTTRL